MEESNHNSKRSKQLVLPAAMLAYSNLTGEDLLVELFKRLPAKTLRRFVCVCKHWKTLISSPPFILLHKSLTCSPTPPNLKPYIQLRDKAYLMCNRQHEHKLYLPFRCTNKKSKRKSELNFVDVIHGVVCVSYSFESGFDSTILWNPRIRKYVPLPRLPFPLELEVVRATDDDRQPRDAVYWTYLPLPTLLLDNYIAMAKFDFNIKGFGYDTSSHVFKVIRIWIPYSGDGSREPSLILPTYEVVECWNPEEGRFRTRVATAPDVVQRCKVYEGSRTSCFVNGTIHWVIRTPDNENAPRSVLMFDCERESFRVVDLPRGIFTYTPIRNSELLRKTKLMEYAGMLSLVVDYCLDNNNNNNQTTTSSVDLKTHDIRLFHTELWAMEEHGVATTWTKLYKFKNNVSDGSLLELDICRDSFVEMAPYSLEKWSRSTRNIKISKEYWYERSIYENRFDEIAGGRVYEESMFLMDFPRPRSKIELVAYPGSRDISMWGAMVNNGRSSVLEAPGNPRPSFGYNFYLRYNNIPSHSHY